MTSVGLGLPGVGAPRQPGPERLAATLPDGRRYGVWLFDVGLACCAVEFSAATLDGSLVDHGVTPYAGTPARADVLVVSGTVTHKTAAAVRRLYEQMPEPRRVISFGSCANSGGPYWDSYCVTKGIDSVVPVDVYVPGCPPRPETVLDALRRLDALTDAEDA